MCSHQSASSGCKGKEQAVIRHISNRSTVSKPGGGPLTNVCPSGVDFTFHFQFEFGMFPLSVSLWSKKVK